MGEWGNKRVRILGFDSSNGRTDVGRGDRLIRQLNLMADPNCSFPFPYSMPSLTNSYFQYSTEFQFSGFIVISAIVDESYRFIIQSFATLIGKQ